MQVGAAADDSPAAARQNARCRGGRGSPRIGGRDAANAGTGTGKETALHTVPLHHVEFGSGRPLLILHGLFGSVRNWQTIARRLSGGHRVICADLRNHGRSPHVDEMGYVSMAADVERLVDELGLERPLLLGHSMGGKVAMTSALRNSARWGALVVVDIAPVQYRNSFFDRIEAMRSMPIASIRSRAEADAWLRDVEPEATIRNFLLHNLVLRDGRYCWQINLDAIAGGLAGIAGFPAFDAPCPLPTLAVRGDRSGAVRPEYEVRLRELFPNVGLVTLATGHWPHAEAPEAFLAAVTPFLESVA
jgi:pimeloyl-ACP methyl ester carboxylesterase